MHKLQAELLRKEKTREELAIQRQLGTELRSCFDDILAAPMPERLRRLLHELDAEAPGGGGGDGGSQISQSAAVGE